MWIVVVMVMVVVVVVDVVQRTKILSPLLGGGGPSPLVREVEKGALPGGRAPWRRAARGWLDFGQAKLPRAGAATGGKLATATSRKRRGRGRVLATSLSR